LSKEPLLSVVIPCYNERATVLDLLKEVKRHAPKGTEILVVDDASTDGTREILKSKASGLAKLIFHEKNRGKGAALRSGFAQAKGRLVVVQDADLEYDPREFKLLMGPILSGKADVVYGSRFMGSGPHRVVYFWHMLGNQVLTLLSNMFTNLNLTDMETCYKMFKREVVQSLDLKEDRFGFEPEITAKLARQRRVIYEVGISYFGRTYAEGKKVNWKDGVRAIYAILRYNLFD
jgi:glycosyltransferase involved in cell wall biosynthesis